MLLYKRTSILKIRKSVVLFYTLILLTLPTYEGPLVVYLHVIGVVSIWVKTISPDTLICPTCNGSFIVEVNRDISEYSQLNQHELDYQNDVFPLISAFLPAFGASDMGSISTVDTPQKTSPRSNGQATQMADEIDHVMPGPSSTGAQSEKPKL